MSHMVIFQTPDGNPGYNQFETVDAAVAFVEKLRNEQNVLNSRIFKLEELKYDFKPYYKVNLQMLNSGAPSAPAAAAPAAPAAAPTAPTAPTAPSAPTSGNGDAPAPVSAPPSGPPVSTIDSPTGRPGGAPTAPPAPAPPASSAPEPEAEPARRGLFGR